MSWPLTLSQMTVDRLSEMSQDHCCMSRSRRFYRVKCRQTPKVLSIREYACTEMRTCP